MPAWGLDEAVPDGHPSHTDLVVLAPVACDLIPYPLLLKEMGDDSEAHLPVECAVRTRKVDGAYSAPYEGSPL